MGGILMRLRRRLPFAVLRDQGGVGAIEFAIVMPFILALYLGASELTFGITADRKVNNAASTISDLVTQQSQVTMERLTQIMGLSTALLAPFDAGQMTITITQVHIDADRKATVDWSTNPTRYPKTTPFVGLPTGIADQADRYIVLTEAVFAYEPVVGYDVLGTFDMKRIAYNQPRIALRIECSDCG